jgi:hypothetical protein
MPVLSKSAPSRKPASIVHPDGCLIPLDTYNLFYRDQLEQTRLAPLRAYSMAVNLTISNPA